MPKADLIQIIEVAVEELYFSGGPDIRKRVEALLGPEEKE
jgi:hypothetical protein